MLLTSLTSYPESQVSVSTQGVGNAGNLLVKAEELVEVSGVDPEPEDGSSFLGASVASGAMGSGGNVTVETDQLSVSDGGRILVSTFGQGEAGSLSIFSNNVEVDGGVDGLLTGLFATVGENATGTGGNINLQVADNITLENNSLISAEALGNADGGNLTVDTNFIIAFPNKIPGDGNDIIASAVEGDGGNISITAESLLGISEGKAIEGNETNDIDASSDFGLDGTVSIFTPDTSVIQGVTELPNNIVEPSQTVAQACSNDRSTALANNFVIKGKGGIPPLITAPLSSEMITINGEIAANSTEGYAIPTSIGDIIPARGVIKTPEGKIILTATPVSGSASRMAHGSLNCG